MKTAAAGTETPAQWTDIAVIRTLYIKPTTKETYIGLCDTTFKLRKRNHVCSFKNDRYKHATELSKDIWNLKHKNIAYDIKWRKIKQA